MFNKPASAPLAMFAALNFLHNSRMGPISQSVLSWQVFPVQEKMNKTKGSSQKINKICYIWTVLMKFKQCFHIKKCHCCFSFFDIILDSQTPLFNIPLNFLSFCKPMPIIQGFFKNYVFFIAIFNYFSYHRHSHPIFQLTFKTF